MKWLIIGIVISVAINGPKHFFLTLVTIFLIFFIYSCFFAYKVLLSVTHNVTANSLKLTFVKFNKAKDISLDNIQRLQIHTRKRYRYRYPIECLKFIKNNKQIFAQEAINGWTIEKFQAIETYFKGLQNNT